MADKANERTEKAPDKAQATASLQVRNEDFAHAASTQTRETLNDVIKNGQMEFSALFPNETTAPAQTREATQREAAGRDTAGNPRDASVGAPRDNAVAADAPRDRAPVPTDRSFSIKSSDNIPGTDKPINPADINEKKEILEGLLKGMSPDQAREVQKDMAALENRKPPISADQVNKIYDATSKLIEDPNHTSKLNQAERDQLAAGILHNASLRTGLDQGFHNTCNVSTLDRRLNVLKPEEAARIVSEAGLTGQFQRKDGSVVKLDAESLHPDNEAKMQFDDRANDNKRNFASQVFDQVAVNDYWQKQNPPLFYSQGAKDSQKDTGERLKYADGREVQGPDGKPMRSPGLTIDNISSVGKDLGFDGQYILGNAQAAGGQNTDGATKIHSYNEFTDALSKSQPPTVIMVNANDQLFGGNGDKGGSGGWHVVTVNDYQAGPPPKVFMTNQWGSANNKWVNVSDLYNSTLPSDAGRVDGNGNTGGGGSDRGSNGGGSGDQSHGSGGQWHRGDGIMGEEENRRWRHDIVEPNAPKDDNQKDHKDHKDQDDLDRLDKDRKAQQLQHAMEQMAPLQARLRLALAGGNDSEAAEIQSQLESLQA